jgi:hypothetical protein
MIPERGWRIVGVILSDPEVQASLAFNVHAPPRSPDDLQQLRVRVAVQAREAASGTVVTCAGCNQGFPLRYLYRCRHCGLWFCGACGEIHFGPAPAVPDAPPPSRRSLIYNLPTALAWLRDRGARAGAGTNFGDAVVAILAHVEALETRLKETSQ